MDGGGGAARAGPLESSPAEGQDWAPAFKDHQLAFLDSFLLWLRGGEKSRGLAWLVGRMEAWVERAGGAGNAASQPALPAVPRLVEWAAAVQVHLVDHARWAESERGRAVAQVNLEDIALLASGMIPKLEELQRWARGIDAALRNVCFKVTFPDIAVEDSALPPLNETQQGVIVWAGMMSRCLEDLCDIAARHHACCELAERASLSGYQHAPLAAASMSQDLSSELTGQSRVLLGFPSTLMATLQRGAEGKALEAQEVLGLLQEGHAAGLSVSVAAPKAPKAGTMFLFRRAATRFKLDGHAWASETHGSLKVGFEHDRIKYYCAQAPALGLQRRCYWDRRADELALVHYLPLPAVGEGAQG